MVQYSKYDNSELKVEASRAGFPYQGFLEYEGIGAVRRLSDRELWEEAPDSKDMS